MGTISQVTITLAICLGSMEAYSAPVTLNISGTDVHVVGEFINAVPVAPGNWEFAPAFTSAHTLSASIQFDTVQPDIDPDPNIGTYQIGALTVQLPQIGLLASRASNTMQISAFNNTPSGNDEFFAFVNGTDVFLNSVGLPNPVWFDVTLFGNTSMLANDSLPVTPLNWRSGNVSFAFVATDQTTRQVLLQFSPVPEPSCLALLAVGACGIGILMRKHSMPGANRA